MSSIYKKGGWLYLQFKGPDGKWQKKASKLPVGREREAQRMLEKIEARIAAGLEIGAGNGTVTVRQYADKWNKDRERLGIADWKNERARLRDHVLPGIGDMGIDEVRPRHLIALVKKWRASVAPKTVRNVYGVVCGLFKEAMIEDLIDSSPCVLTKRHLGDNTDKDPEWRPTARYSRAELESLVSDNQIPWDRQIVYGLEGIGGLRHGEAAGLRWRHYDIDRKPLGGLLIATSYDKGRTKTNRTRWVPVHPVLAAMLAEWRLSGWARLMGRQPTADDLIVPMPPEHAARRRTRDDAEGMRQASYSRDRLLDDFATLSFRRRRGHDLRRTFISLAREDGARGEILKLCTHTEKGRQSIDIYTTLPWESLCGEVAKLKIQRRREQVIPIRAVVGGGEAPSDGGNTPEQPDSYYSLTTQEKKTNNTNRVLAEAHGNRSQRTEQIITAIASEELRDSGELSRQSGVTTSVEESDAAKTSSRVVSSLPASCDAPVRDEIACQLVAAHDDWLGDKNPNVLRRRLLDLLQRLED